MIMTKKELESILKLLQDCDDYLAGKKHSTWIADIAQSAATRAVIERKNSLYERLQHAGLNISEEV